MPNGRIMTTVKIIGKVHAEETFIFSPYLMWHSLPPIFMATAYNILNLKTRKVDYFRELICCYLVNKFLLLDFTDSTGHVRVLYLRGRILRTLIQNSEAPSGMFILYIVSERRFFIFFILLHKY